MFTQTRLHFARIASPAVDPCIALFADAEATVRTRLLELDMTRSLMWDLVQFLDLADAGYGNTSDALYLVAQGRVKRFVLEQPEHAIVRELVGKSCALARVLKAREREEALAMDAYETVEAQAA